MLAIITLVFIMGLRMGSNKDVTGNLNSIGLYAFVMTVVIMGLCVILIGITRKFFGINRYGEMGGSDVKPEHAVENQGSGRKIDKMTIYILCSVGSGMVLGYFFILRIFSDFAVFDHLAGILIKIGLCVMLTFVGMDLGLDGTVFTNMKKVGFRILVFPFVTVAGSIGGGLICSLFLPITAKEAMAIGAGFGWYTLAPGIIMANGYMTAGAISFMHNVMRELFSIILIPTVARKIGYVETTCLPGAAAMDVCLPIVERATSSNTAVYSFVSGVVLSTAVPILVPLIIG